jgi:hypothetical protein
LARIAQLFKPKKRKYKVKRCASICTFISEPFLNEQRSINRRMNPTVDYFLKRQSRSKCRLKINFTHKKSQTIDNKRIAPITINNEQTAIA